METASFGNGTALDPSIDTEEIFSSVLLVEDEPAHAALITRALKGIVGEIIHAKSGNEAVEALHTQFVELVLSDLHLPDTTGIELLANIQAARPDLPVIVMTSSNNLDDAVRAMREGAWDYMVKEFSDDLRGRMSLMITRNAERRMQNLREQEVRSERAAFWAAANTAQDGLAILGAEGHIVFTNQNFSFLCERVFGKEAPSSNIVDLLAYHDHHVARGLYEHLHSRGGELLWSSEFEVEGVKTADGSEKRMFELTLSSVSLGDVGGIGIVARILPDMRRSVIWIRDITRRREQEKFQRDLLATTSHDLKGPLGAILSSAELLQDGDLSPENSAKIITRIASCARNSISIIDELLSARRIQDGVLSVRPNWHEMEEFLEDLLLDYLPMAKAKNIQFTCKPISSGLRVYADRIALSRVLGNLVSNALKFTPKEGRVELAAEHDGNYCAISVSDTGPGIEANARHVLFERYSRLDKHQEVEGTGLGLFVAKNIVEAHAGRIQVLSEVGVGTTFIVSFPDEVAK